MEFEIDDEHGEKHRALATRKFSQVLAAKRKGVFKEQLAPDLILSNGASRHALP